MQQEAAVAASVYLGKGIKAKVLQDSRETTAIQQKEREIARLKLAAKEATSY